ncbi:MAG: hypothetical protein IJ633_03580 [Prevotella sp.]|nr:hypothetical protein [Prevotella sp.]
MRNLWAIAATMFLMACASNNDDDGLNLTSRFNGTWNIHETYERNSDGSITYHAIPWGGLVGSMRERNLPVDWSGYESITVEFAQPTNTTTQLKISQNMRVYGKPGISSLVFYFDGQDASQIDEVILQTADSCALTVNRIFLTPGTSVWNPTPIWEGECAFGNFQQHIIIEADPFLEAQEGDQLEFIYENDCSDPSVQYWNIKTIYKDTEETLEGNANQLNEWGCASLGASGVFRIRLSAKDIKELRKRGLFVVGYQSVVYKVNLLRRGVAIETSEHTEVSEK